MAMASWDEDGFAAIDANHNSHTGEKYTHRARYIAG